MSYVLGCVAHAQWEHDPGLWADSSHTGRELSRWTCGRHDGRQGAAEQRASRLNQLGLVLVTPLSVHAQRQSQGMRNGQKREKTDIMSFEWTKKLADIGAKLNSRPEKVLFFPSLTNWFGRASGAGLIKRRCRPGYAVELALFEKHSMQ